MYVCMYVCMYIHTYIYVRGSMEMCSQIQWHLWAWSTYSYVYVHVHAYVYVQTCIHKNILIYTNTQNDLLICSFACTVCCMLYVHTNTYIHTQTHACMYIYIHTHTCTYTRNTGSDSEYCGNLRLSVKQCHWLQANVFLANGSDGKLGNERLLYLASRVSTYVCVRVCVSVYLCVCVCVYDTCDIWNSF